MELTDREHAIMTTHHHYRSMIADIGIMGTIMGRFNDCELEDKINSVITAMSTLEYSIEDQYDEELEDIEKGIYK